MQDGERLYDLLEGFDTAMLVTRGADGGFHARPMVVAELHADADAYFVTSMDSPKVAEIYADADVLLTFQNASRYAAVYGRVNLIDDPALIGRVWKHTWHAWFPRGKTDPSIVLLRFDAERGEFWNEAGLPSARYAFEAAKAYLRGEAPPTDPGRHGRARF